MRQIQARKHKKEHYDNMFRFYWSILLWARIEKKKTSRHRPYVQDLQGQDQDIVQDFLSRLDMKPQMHLVEISIFSCTCMLHNSQQILSGPAILPYIDFARSSHLFLVEIMFVTCHSCHSLLGGQLGGFIGGPCRGF